MSELSFPSETTTLSRETPNLPSGSLPIWEWCFRAGLLLGAILFFQDALDWPWTRNLFGLAGMAMAVLMVLTMVFRWRVLDDWRRRPHQTLYIGLALAVSFPLAAAFSPTLGSSALPPYLEEPLAAFLAALDRMPGISVMVQFTLGFLSFLFFGFTLLVLAFGRGPVALGFLGVVVGGACLFFYPAVDTVAGFIFLAIFLNAQWRTPLIIPDRLEQHLKPVQKEYLRVLMKDGALSTGETKIFLDNNPAYFGELLDCRLVEYDSIAREVIPGDRLLRGSSGGGMDTFMEIVRRGFWFIVAITYFIMPDLIPGPIDDVIVMALCTLTGTGLLKTAGDYRRGRRLK